MKRRLKIYSQSMGGGSYTQVPTLLLKGKWMEEAGFRFGDYVEVNVENEVMTIKKTIPPETAGKKTLQEKIDGLSPEQKEKLSHLIDKL